MATLREAAKHLRGGMMENLGYSPHMLLTSDFSEMIKCDTHYLC